MNPRTTIILLVLFFAGLVGLWWADYAKVPDYRQRQRMFGRVLPELVDVRPEEIRRIEITGGEHRLVFARRGDDPWQMIEPVDTLADRSRIAILLNNLKDLRKNADVQTIEGRAATLGLDPPARAVRLFGADPRTPLAGLELGRTLGTQGYVRPLGQGGIEVADAQRLSPLELPASSWRERALVGLSPYDVASLTITGPGHELGVQLDDGRWQLRRPVRAPADPHEVEGVLADLAALRVVDGDQGFVADDVRDMAPFGLDPPRLRIEATPSSAPGKPRAKAEVVLIGKDVPGLVDRAYARRGDQDDVVRIDVRPLRDLGAHPNALRSHKVADFDPGRVASLRIRVGEVEHELARGPGGWTSAGAWAGRADPQVISDLLARLNTLQTGDFLDPKAVDRPGLDPPWASLQVWLRGPATQADARASSAAPAGPPDVDLRIGRHDVGRKALYAQEHGDPSLLVLPDSFLEVLPRDALAFRERTISALDPRQIGRVTVRQGGKAVVVEAATPGGWRMTAPVRALADPEAVARLTVLLARLRADRLVDSRPADLKPYGLEAPGLVVSWTGKAGADGTLSVGRDVPGAAGARYATIAGDPMVFTLKPEAIPILTAELHDRRVVEFPADQAARLVVRRPDRSFRFARKARPSAADPSGWEPEAGSASPGFEVSRVEPLITALANLRALRFEQYDGPIPAGVGLSPPVVSLQVQLKGDLGTRELRLGLTAGPGQRWATTEAGAAGAVFVLPEAGWEPYLPPARPGPSVLPEDVFAPDAAPPR
jgi:hypothetical protein